MYLRSNAASKLPSVLTLYKPVVEQPFVHFTGNAQDLSGSLGPRPGSWREPVCQVCSLLPSACRQGALSGQASAALAQSCHRYKTVPSGKLFVLLTVQLLSCNEGWDFHCMLEGTMYVSHSMTCRHRAVHTVSMSPNACMVLPYLVN